MSNMELVAELVAELGEATVDSIFDAIQRLPEEDRITKPQITSALHYAKLSERIQFLRLDPRPGRRSRQPIVYGPVDRKPAPRPVSSVWEYARRSGT